MTPEFSFLAARLRAGSLLLAFAAVIVFGLAESRAAGTPVVWNGSGGDGSWTNLNNWTTPPANFATLTDLSPTFGGTNGLTNTNTTYTSLSRITFTATAGAFVINGSGAGASVSMADRIENSSTNVQTINLNLSYAVVEEVNVYSNTGTTILNGVISGAGGLLVNDRTAATTTGLLVLNASNTLTGAVTTTAGRLRIANDWALGTTNAGTTLAAAATLELTTNSSGQGISVAEAITNSGTIRNIAGTNTISGLVTLAAASTNISDAGTLIFNRAGMSISGTADNLTFGGAGNIVIATTFSNTAGTLTKTGAGTLTLAASNAYSGATTINAGTIAISNGGAFGSNSVTFASNGTTVLSLASLQVTNNFVLTGNGTMDVGSNTQTNSGVVSGAGTLTKLGAGTLVLGNAVNTYSGVTTIGGGVLRVTNLAASGANSSLGSGTTIIITNGGTLDYAGATNSAMNRGINLLSGQGVFSVSNALVAVTNTGVISNSGSLVKGGAGTLILSGANTYSGATTISNGALVVTGSGAISTNALDLAASGASLTISNLTAAGATVASLSGVSGSTITLGAKSLTVGSDNTSTAYAGTLTGTNGALNKTGAGTLTLSGANSYTGATTIGGGTLSVSADNNLGTAPGAATAGQLTMSNGGTLAVTSGFTLNSNRGVALGTGGGGFNVASGQTLSYGGIITGANTLTKSGLGTLTLSGANAYANTIHNSGTLNINNNNALGNLAGTFTLGDGVTIDNTSGGAISVVNAKSISIGSSLNFLGANSLNLGTGTVTFSTNTTIDVAANVLRFDGDVIGSGLGLTKTGAGTLEFHGLTGSNSYTGNTFINGGKLFLTGTSVFGGTTNTTVTVASNAFLEIGNSASVGNVTVVSRPDGWINNATNVITADIVYDQSGTLTANNANYNGTTTIESGVTISSADDFFGVVPTNTVADRIILQNNATLQATASFDIEANQGVQLSSGTATIASAGTNVALFVNSVVSGSGELRKTGSGNIRLLGTNTYTGGTVIDQGIIGIVSDASLGDVSGRLKLNGGSVVAAQTISGPTNSGTTINASRDLVLGNGTTSGLQAQTGLNLTYNGVIAEEGAGPAANVFVGTAGPRAGTVTLGGLNTYQGTTTLNAGVLEVANLANGGQASGIGQSGSAASNLVLNSGTLRFTGSSASTDRLFTIGGPTVTLDTGTGSLAFTNTGSLLFSSTNVSSQITLSGAGAGELAAAIADASGSNATSLAKSGAGTWTLSGNGTFTGGTFLNEGTLRLASTTAAGSGSIAQSSGSSTLVIDTAGTVANDMDIYNVTTLQTVTLTGAKNLNNATYNVTNSTTTTEAGTLSDTGGITKIGTGTLILTASNNFTGAVDVQAGLLSLNSATGAAAGSTASVSVSTNATLLIAQNSQVNDAATVSLSGGTIRTAAGVSEVFGNLSVTGSGFLDFGTTSYANANTISFGTYSYTPSALLTINNFDFGSTMTFSSNLSAGDLATFSFTNGGIASTNWDGSTFTITAIPEPSTYLAAAGLLAVMLWPSRRRLLKDAKRILGLTAPMRDRLAARRA